MTATPGTWHDSDPAATVPIERAKQAWAVAARPILEGTARTYNATTTYKDLAAEVQDATGFRTRMLVHYWIGDVLGRVARDCHARGEPLLSSLCIDATGSVGEGYGIALEQTYGGERPDDLDAHAALERLACYRFFGAELPPNGGEPTLAPRLASRRTCERQEQARLTPRPVCPTCHLELPRSGRCDICAGD